jgi:hypothetical protein
MLRQRIWRLRYWDLWFEMTADAEHEHSCDSRFLRVSKNPVEVRPTSISSNVLCFNSYCVPAVACPAETCATICFPTMNHRRLVSCSCTSGFLNRPASLGLRQSDPSHASHPYAFPLHLNFNLKHALKIGTPANRRSWSRMTPLGHLAAAVSQRPQKRGSAAHLLHEPSELNPNLHDPHHILSVSFYAYRHSQLLKYQKNCEEAKYRQ